MTTTGDSPARSSRPIFARVWTVAGRQLDKQGAVAYRQQLVAGLHGRVIEIGAGDGRNFAHYPSTVDEVVAVEPERYLRERAQTAAADAPVPVRVADGVAESLPVTDGSTDAAVVSLVLCSVEDLPGALGEIRRVLRPQGRLRFFEHVVADTAALRGVQKGLDATVWPRLGGGCHAARDTLAAMSAAGFSVTGVEGFRFPNRWMPTSPHVLGEATTAESATEAR